MLLFMTCAITPPTCIGRTLDCELLCVSQGLLCGGLSLTTISHKPGCVALQDSNVQHQCKLHHKRQSANDFTQSTLTNLSGKNKGRQPLLITLVLPQAQHLTVVFQLNALADAVRIHFDAHGAGRLSPKFAHIHSTAPI